MLNVKKHHAHYLRLAVSDGQKIASRDSLPALHRHVGESEFPCAQRFDLPGPPFRDLFVPHADRFSADAERVAEGLMCPAEVVEDLLESNGRHGHQNASEEGGPSVSVLPHPVKSLTRSKRVRISKLNYMSKKRTPKDPWAIARGAAMKEARRALGKSQAEIASLAGIKDRETISQYESGLIEDIDASLIPKLATALGMPPQQLSRTPWNNRDEGLDLRVSTVARQIAYNFDEYPLIIQNQIRETIAKYESLVKQHGKAAVDRMYEPGDTHLPHSRQAPPLLERPKQRHAR